MRLEIRRAGSKKEFFREIVLWALPVLKISSRTSAVMDLTINFKKGLRAETGCDGLAGIGDADDGKTYRVDIEASADLLTKVSIIFHELVHIKQFAKKELDDSRRYHKFKWKGQLYNYETVQGALDQPWEIEAYGMERLLLLYWLREYSGKHPTIVKRLKVAALEKHI